MYGQCPAGCCLSQERGLKRERPGACDTPGLSLLSVAKRYVRLSRKPCHIGENAELPGRIGTHSQYAVQGKGVQGEGISGTGLLPVFAQDEQGTGEEDRERCHGSVNVEGRIHMVYVHSKTITSLSL